MAMIQMMTVSSVDIIELVGVSCEIAFDVPIIRSIVHLHIHEVGLYHHKIGPYHHEVG